MGKFLGGHQAVISALCGLFLAAAPFRAVAAEPVPDTIFSLLCGKELNRTCEQAVPRVAQLFETRIREQANKPGTTLGYYHLKDLLIVPKPGSSLRLGFDDFESFQKPFEEACSLNGNRFNGGEPEKDTNHLGRSCGTPDTIECRTSSTREIRAQLLAGTGTREMTYLRGAYLEALDCVSREIAAEIRENRELRIPGDEATNPCLKFMSDHAAIRQKLTDLATKASAEQKARCRFSSEGVPEQAGCYADAALESSDALFTAVAACEAFRRADQGYLALERTVHSMDSRRKLWSEHSKACSAQATCASFSSCVRGKYMEKIQAESRQRFPKLADGGKCSIR
jgi:hypothetical protein